MCLQCCWLSCVCCSGALGALAFFLAGQFLLSVTMSDYKVALQSFFSLRLCPTIKLLCKVIILFLAPGAYFKMHALCTPTYLLILPMYLPSGSICQASSSCAVQRSDTRYFQCHFQIRVSDQCLFDLVTYEYHIYLPTYLPSNRSEGARAKNGTRKKCNFSPQPTTTSTRQAG